MWFDFLAELSPEVNQNGGEFRFATKTMAPYEIASNQKRGLIFELLQKGFRTQTHLTRTQDTRLGKLNTTLVLERLVYVCQQILPQVSF